MSNSRLCVDQMVDEEMSEPEDESEVKVLLLSPRCWAVSAPCYLKNPAKYFPQKLCTYLDEFTDFYSNSKLVFTYLLCSPHNGYYLTIIKLKLFLSYSSFLYVSMYKLLALFDYF